MNGPADQTIVYNVQSFGGTKAVILSTSTWMGGNNPFLGTAYMTVGLLILVTAICFLVGHLLRPR